MDSSSFIIPNIEPKKQPGSKKHYFLYASAFVIVGITALIVNVTKSSFYSSSKAATSQVMPTKIIPRTPTPTSGSVQTVATIAIKDPFYPDYSQRRILFPTSNLSWWGTPGLSRYTITSTDPRVGNRSVTFYSSGYYACQNGVEMGLPFGNAPGSQYNHFACGLTASDDFNFFFPRNITTGAVALLDSPAQITLENSTPVSIYVPLTWWLP